MISGANVTTLSADQARLCYQIGAAGSLGCFIVSLDQADLTLRLSVPPLLTRLTI
jgi:hypothetical protein